MKKNNVFTCWAVTFLLILSAGCSNLAPGESKKELVPISSIGVLPAHAADHLPSTSGVNEEFKAGVETINAFLADYFADFQDVSLISQSELQGISYTDSGKLLYLAREAGQQLRYDAVLIATVHRYKERDGTEYSVMTPASVAFSLKLLAVESGQIIWSADFDQTQEPLLSNILKSRSTGSGFRWLTAAELASAGLTKKLNSSPYMTKD